MTALQQAVRQARECPELRDTGQSTQELRGRVAWAQKQRDCRDPFGCRLGRAGRMGWHVLCWYPSVAVDTQEGVLGARSHGRQRLSV